MKTCPVCGEEIADAAECWRCGSRWEAGGSFRPGALQRGARRPGRRRKRPLLADDEKWVSGDDAAWTGCCLLDVLGWFWPAAALVLIASAAHAQQPALGTWDLTTVSPEGEFKSVMEVREEAGKLIAGVAR